MNYIGLDLSLTSTGVCVLDDRGGLVASRAIKTKPSGQSLKPRYIRLELIWSRLAELLSIGDGIAIEGYSFGSNMSGVAPRIELGAIVRSRLLRNREINGLIEVAPKSLKKWATGNGNANKPQVMAAIKKRYGVEFATDDEADAFCLAKIAWQLQDVNRCKTFQEECVVMQILSKGD